MTEFCFPDTPDRDHDWDVELPASGNVVFESPTSDQAELAATEEAFDRACSVYREALSAGFRTMQLPAASAGASFHTAIRIGKFHGIICPTTPSGS